MIKSYEAPKILTFNGADGVGKTTLAIATNAALENTYNGSAFMRGMGYKEWDKPPFARLADDYMASWIEAEDIERPVSLPDGRSVSIADAQTATFQFIAKRCYYRSQQMRSEERSFVVIDSDPYLKGLMWAIVNDAQEQKQSWHDIVTPDSAFPDVVTTVLADRNYALAAFVALRRITARLGNSSPFDPQNEDDSLRRINAADQALVDVLECGRTPELFTIINDQVSQTNINQRAVILTSSLLNRLLN